MFVKINHLLNERGQADYKGLDISMNVPGSQIYALIDGNNYCVLETGETILPDHPDLIELDHLTYEQEREEILSKITPPTDPVEELKKENAELKQAIADLTMTMATMMGA